MEFRYMSLQHVTGMDLSAAAIKGNVQSSYGAVESANSLVMVL